MEDDVLSYRKDVLMHYEPSVQGGTVFLFKCELKTFWTGNLDSFEILKRIDGVKTFNNILSELLLIYGNEKSVREESKKLIFELKNKQFLEA